MKTAFYDVTSSILQYISEMGYVDCSDQHIIDCIDWLSLCGCIEGVSVSPDLSDESTLWCKSSLEYEMNRSEFVSQISYELARFHFACSALECLMRFYNINHKDTGLALHLAQLYKSKNLIEQIPKEYFDLLSLLHDKFSNNSYFTKDLKDFSDKIKNVLIDKSGHGILLIYKLRNHFAHGSISLSTQFGDFNEDDEPDISLIRLSSLMILINIIFLFMIDPISDQKIIDPSFLDIPSGQKANKFLRNIIRSIKILV